jgi:hypothetical protein
MVMLRNFGIAVSRYCRALGSAQAILYETKGAALLKRAERSPDHVGKEMSRMEQERDFMPHRLENANERDGIQYCHIRDHHQSLSLSAESTDFPCSTSKKKDY